MSMKNLVIVESPAKAKTIEKYLGKDYKVLASMGHVRDLPKSTLGVDVEKNYEPSYVTMKGKATVISDLKKKVPDRGTVYLAQDLDREGEAIAWHVGQSLGLFDETGKTKKVRGKSVNYRRIVFNEITKEAILQAIKDARDVDMNLVDAQQARRVLDRLVGYKLSPLLWQKIRYGLSAGRVQSVATRLIVDRERERKAFRPEEYWTLVASLTKKVFSNPLDFEFVSFKGKKLDLKNESCVKTLESQLLKNKSWIVSKIKDSSVNKNPAAPFTTSTLQQSAYNKLGFTSKKTMGIAQKLYQGVDAGGNGHVAMITYMRTDSTNLSKEALASIRTFVQDSYGRDLLPENPRIYKTKSKSAQEAHEAIRPTNISMTPEIASKFLESDDLKLYSLIWKRTVATQMNSAEYLKRNIEVLNGEYLFRNSNQVLQKPGYLTVYGQQKANLEDFDIKEGDLLDFVKFIHTQHFTEPPPRYNEASLVKALESFGIGRPSTYSAIISTIQVRGYVSKENKAFKPEDIGYVVTDLLVKHFPEIVDIGFTAKIEDDLDSVAEGKKKWVPVIDDFYKPFEKLLEKKSKEINKDDFVVLEKSDEKCELCGSEMLVKLGKFGRFLSCSKFPECKGIKSIAVEGETDLLEKYEPAGVCEKCGSKMFLKRGKYGLFWACEKYPECKGTAPLLLKEKCPDCGKGLVERRSKWGKTFTGCSGYPDCKFIKKSKKELNQ